MAVHLAAGVGPQRSPRGLAVVVVMRLAAGAGLEASCQSAQKAILQPKDYVLSLLIRKGAAPTRLAFSSV